MQDQDSSSPHELPVSKFKAGKSFTETKKKDSRIRDHSEPRIPYMQRILTPNAS